MEKYTTTKIKESEKATKRLCRKCQVEDGNVKKTLYGYAIKNYWGGDTIEQTNKMIFLCKKCSELEEQNHELEKKFRDEIFRNDNGGYAGGGEVVAYGAIKHAKEIGAFAVNKSITVGKDVGKYAVDTSIKVGDGLIHEREAGAFLVKEGVSVAGGALAVGTTDDLKELVEKTGTDVKEVTEKIIGETADVTKKIVENFNIFGVGKGIADSLGNSIGSTEKAKAERDVKIAEANAKARTEEIENLKKQLEELKKERDKQIAKLEEQLRKKDKKIDRLELKVEKLEDRLEAQIEVKK